MTDGTGPQTPRATYRLQLRGDFTLHDAADVVGYLDRLGISHLYLSPVLTAPEGAAHGYHITDPTQINPEIGGDDGITALRQALHSRGMAAILDIVPNHLAANVDNPWWRDVLAHGPASAYAPYFDIDWAAGDGRVVLPILGRPVDEAIDAGEITVEDDVIVYFDNRLPLTPTTRGRANEATSATAVRSLLAAQHYRLTYWRTGVQDLNYRRFFDITDLVGVRVEDPDVFDARHERVLDLVRDGTVTGLRVDHVDGLRDPLGYLHMLEEAARDAAGGEGVYVVVEKILEGDEPLPQDWPVAGTTGYELLTATNAVQIEAQGLAVIDDAYTRFTGRALRVHDLLHGKKVAALDDLFGGEVDRLVGRLTSLATRVPDAPTLDPGSVRRALVAVTACFPVYRTYIRDGAVPPSDRAHLEQAVGEARRRHPGADGALVYLERVLMMDLPVGLADDLRRDWLDVVMRWQQLTGPAMAKGFEDTTFYLVNRLISLNEVGVDAHGIDRPPGLAGFHERTAARTDAWPQAMNTTSTHDTKRSEDVRARLNVLTEIPDVWAEAVDRWHTLNRDARTPTAPNTNEEWMIYQSLVGVWPLDPGDEAGVADRVAEFAVKAAREGKETTSWLDPDERHEEGLRRFVTRILADESFLDEMRRFAARIALPGVVNSLAQVAVKMLAPGVPDTYQGCELWDFSLVDPDNRRPVDYARRSDVLDTIVERAAADRLVLTRELRDDWRDGRLKLFVTWALLGLRREREELLRDGGYLPLRTTGTHAGRTLAFARTHGDDWVAVVVPRLAVSLAPGGWPTADAWEDTVVELPDRRPVREHLTGLRHEQDAGGLRFAKALGAIPVAVVHPA